MAETKAPAAVPTDNGKDFFVSAPAVSLPKGGGAIRGMGEKFAANPVTGTGSMSVPIATSPGRGGFGPQLALAYDSGAGNGPFGFGWSLSLPSITRKTDKGLPRYDDASESDVFILSGAEDLVPVYRQDAAGTWVLDAQGKMVIHEDDRTIDEVPYKVRRYRPRIEGSFARIERWTNVATGEKHWRSISQDNITTLYGKDNNSRIFDPADPDPAHPTRIFSWLICESYDDKGNAIVYEYAAENDAGVDRTQANERNRIRTANRYLKRIKYGNRVSRLVQPDLSRAAWMFEVVFDYDEGHVFNEMTDADQRTFVEASVTSTQDWIQRFDPFSSYRAGFEMRTYRLCQRVLMFHHIPDLSRDEKGYDGLVRSTDFSYSYERNRDNAANPIYSFLCSVTQSGYKRAGNRYFRRSLPPVEFEYTQPNVQKTVGEVDAESLENLPVGLNGAYQWTDLHGEGIPGILTEQAGAWFYKRNLSPINLKGDNGASHVEAKFAHVELVATKPNLALAGGAQFMDLAGDGQPDLAVFDGPMPGLYEHDSAEGWQSFRPFTARLNRDTRDPNLKFVDLDGDGHADVLISEDDVFVWHPSLAAEGFGPALRVHQALDEEKGPRLVFADGTESIYLADLSGDGLTDLARIRNGEVCYWPNLGYGRFGAKVTMDNAPWFDHIDQFEQKRIRLADIDGSGTTDIIYLHRDGVRLYFNQTGNGWGAPQPLPVTLRVDDLVAITAVDLLGNGTACLVWSSPLPWDTRRQMRYVNLMGDQKPHLLIKTRNNLGAETEVEYAPSTKFYLQDKYAGRPWITKLPFPVHVVEKVTVRDRWRKVEFSSTYSYHHGYFDGTEREFRGFGRVEQIDVEDFGRFAAGNAASPYITGDRNLYQPPVKTVTWYHTGAFLDREHILTQFEHEYFPHWYEALDPSRTNVLGAFQEDVLPQPDLAQQDLAADEWRQALRACKGMPLRQEIYELDVDALQKGQQEAVKLFSTAYHDCHIQRVQPQAGNRHAVYLVTESEAITYHYELDLRPDTLTPDPRIAHTLNLATDEYGNVLQSVAAVYPRIGQFDDGSLQSGDLDLIRSVQSELHLAYTENRFTQDVDDADTHRLRQPCEVLTYELTGIAAEDADDRVTPDPRDNRYLTLDELRRYRLSTMHQTGGTAVAEIPYHTVPDRATPQKRLVEHVRVLFFDENLSDPLPLGQLGRLGLPYETYKLALTEDLLAAVFGNKLTADVRRRLDNPDISGYLSISALAARFHGDSATGQYWLRSGIAGFAADADRHFFLPERYTDPFGQVTTLAYDPLDLYIASSADPLGNVTRVTRFDYRVLAPSEMQDINGNLSEVCFDVLGLPAAMALKGKGTEGDNLDGLRDDDALLNPTAVDLEAFFAGAAFDEQQARDWLGNATARHVYYFGNAPTATGKVLPACAAGILREQHASQNVNSPLQAAFEYSDGLGAVVVKKIQAEPAAAGGPLRWIASGKTVMNNKGKPVKQYEPYFCRPDTGHRYDAAESEHEEGVTPVMYYDASGRLVRTEAPDGSFSRIGFSPWHVQTFDQNDTVRESRWYADRNPPDPDRPLPRHPITGEIAVTPEQRAAWLAAQHTNTPALTILDSLGREVIIIAHNKYLDQSGARRDEKYLTYTKLDAEGKPLWIRDARGNLVMQYITPVKPTRAADEPDPTKPETVPAGAVPCYDIAGNLLFQHSMDAGDRWTLNDAAGKMLFAWDRNERRNDAGLAMEERRYFTSYDALHRPLEVWLEINQAAKYLIEQFVYGDTLPDTVAARWRNLRGQLHQHYDSSGLQQVERIDFRGKPVEVRRQLAAAVTAQIIDWQPGSPTAGLETETFTQITEYDALSRMTRLYNWHRGPGHWVAVYEPKYNARGLLGGEEIVVRATKADLGYIEERGAQRTQALKAIFYNAKGQKERVDCGNGTITRYDYDLETFRRRQLRTTRPGYNPRFPDHHSNLRDPQVLQQLHYTYDPAGNITEIYDEAYEPVFFQNQQVEPRSRYTYDAVYRLIEASGRENGAATGSPPQIQQPEQVTFPVTDQRALRNYTQNYIYDPVGNIAEMGHAAGLTGGWTRHYAYATDSNRLLRTWEGDANWDNRTATNRVTYRYDIHGNVLNLADVASRQELRWDHTDMIHALDLVGGGWAYCNYDAGKQRSRKRLERQGDTVEERLYLGGLEIYRKSIGGKLVEEIETLHLFEGAQRVLLVDDVLQTDNARLATGPRYRYQYNNHLGSAVVELDEQTEIISYEEYHPYGTSAYRASNQRVEAPAKRYRFTGKERDEESGLYYHGARYYAPWFGKWISCDPSGLTDGVNAYVFVRGNPITYRDSDGRISEDTEENVKQLGRDVWRSWSSMVDFTGKAFKVAEVAERGEYSEAAAVALGVDELTERATYFEASGATLLETAALMVSERTGMTDVLEAATGESLEGETLTTGERIQKGISGGASVLGTALGGVEGFRNLKGTPSAPKPKMEEPKITRWSEGPKPPSADTPEGAFRRAQQLNHASKAQRASELGTRPESRLSPKKPKGYIPKDPETGRHIPLDKRNDLPGVSDVPLPDPLAGRHAHSVLGGKISSETGKLYRQSALFPEGADVPLGRVDWGTHNRPMVHPDPHVHGYHYDGFHKRWIEGPPQGFPTR